MKGLPNLIRLHRWRLDEKRKNLAELERLAEELRDQGRRIEEEMRAEQAAAGASTEAGFAYAAYARAVIARRAKLAASLADAKAKIAAAAVEVTESFQELKRLELAQEHRITAERQRTARLDQAVLDELGIALHRRNSENQR